MFWWLTLCVKLTAYYLGNTWITGNTLFLGMSVRVFLEEIRTWFRRLREETPSSIHWGTNGTKRERKGEFTFSVLGLEHWYFPVLRHQSSSFSSLQAETKLYHWLSWFSCLQIPDWDFSTSITLSEPIPILKNINTYMYVYTHTHTHTIGSWTTWGLGVLTLHKVKNPLVTYSWPSFSAVP